MFERGPRAFFRRLVVEPPRLQLDILAVRVGKQPLPNHPLPRKTPNPNLPPGLVVVAGAFDDAEILVVPIAAEEIGITAQDVVRFVAAEVVVVVIRDVRFLLSVVWPIAMLALVADIARPRKDALQVAGRLDGRVHPRVIRLLQRRGIVPERRRREVGLVLRQVDFEPPGGASEQVERADRTTHAAIGVDMRDIVHRRCNWSCVR